MIWFYYYVSMLFWYIHFIPISLFYIPSVIKCIKEKQRAESVINATVCLQYIYLYIHICVLFASSIWLNIDNQWILFSIHWFAFLGGYISKIHGRINCFLLKLQNWWSNFQTNCLWRFRFLIIRVCCIHLHYITF